MEQNRGTLISDKQIFNSVNFNNIKPFDIDESSLTETIQLSPNINEEIIPLTSEQNNKYSESHLNSNEYLETMSNLRDQFSKCKFCRKKFDRVSDLLIHKKSHTDEQLFSHLPFKCTICPKAFNTIKKLKMHSKEHPSKKSHKCNVCSKCFLRFESLHQHALATHGILKTN